MSVVMLSLLGCLVLVPAGEWDDFAAAHLQGRFARHPTEAVQLGRHEFDGKLPDWSEQGLTELASWLKSEWERAQGFLEASLDERQRLERQVLVAALDGELFWLEEADLPHRSPAFYTGALDPDVYLSRPYAPLATRLDAFVEYLRALPVAAAQIRRNLVPPLPRTFVALGRLSFGGMADFFEGDVPAIFAALDDEARQAALRPALASAVSALRGLDAWLAGLEASATEDFALGRERFQRMLWATERVDLPIEQLLAIGQADLRRNLDALASCCREGESVQELIARVAADKPAGGPVEAARAQLDALRDFLLEKDLVGIPGTEVALVEQAPPYNAWNFAYISIPGPYETDLPSTYFIAPPDPKWTEQERKDYLPGAADLLFTSVHEVWPGHFLQFLHSNRAPSPLLRVLVGYAFAEGWAHYTEELMWEAGLGDGDGATHAGQILNALLRNVRFLSAIGLHTSGMSVEESELMFREKAYQDAGNARQQAARGTFDPAYLNYTLGKLMIRKLRDDWTRARGGRAAWRAFHDELLSHGGPPLPLLRAVLLGKEAGELF